MHVSPVLNSAVKSKPPAVRVVVDSERFYDKRYNAGLTEHISISSLPAKIKSLECNQIVCLRESPIVAAHLGSFFYSRKQ
jgi:hypothetical protein